MKHIVTYFAFAPGVDLVKALAAARKAVTLTYEVCRVKDNEVVLVAKTRDEADALVEKHVRQKKAKLFVRTSEE